VEPEAGIPRGSEHLSRAELTSPCILDPGWRWTDFQRIRGFLRECTT